MIAFELTMPNVGSWNGIWSGANRRYIKTFPERKVPKELWGKSFYYRWDDGWGASISVEKISCAEAKKLERISSGFLSYGWMIESIIKNGEIRYKRGQEI